VKRPISGCGSCSSSASSLRSRTVLGIAFAIAVSANLALVLFWHQRDTVT
jgi:hypothetical protein